MIPFQPFKGFTWVLLGIFVLFAYLDSKAAIASAIWFGFASHYLCDITSKRYMNKPFQFPHKIIGSQKKFTWLDNALVFPLLIGTLVPALGLGVLMDCINKTSNWVKVVAFCQ